MLVNPSKTRQMLISRSRTVEPLFPDLVIVVLLWRWFLS